jgi:ATP-binding cassette subfamily B protein
VIPAAEEKRLPLGKRIRNLGTIFRQLPGTFRLLWGSSRRGAIALGALTAFSALLPAAIAWVGKLIIDSVVKASQTHSPADRMLVFRYVVIELGLMIATTASSRVYRLLNEIIGARLGFDLSVRILQKALDLELRHFEDAEVYDKMQNARREASARPLNLANSALQIFESFITLATYAVLIIRISPWSVLVLVAASVPSFLSEVRFAGESFRLNSWRAPEGRKLNYLEWVLTRDNHIKEVKLFEIGPLILGRYKTLFAKFYSEDRRLAIRRMAWGLSLGFVSLGAFYGCYLWVAGQAAWGRITLGDMALYLQVFRQGQSSFQSMLSSVGAMYEDSLFMSNLFLYLGIATGGEKPRRDPPLTVPRGKSQRVELRRVSFRYPGKDAWALKDVSLVLEPGEKLGLVGENGAGKSTLVKLLMRLYDPTEGEILYGGVDIRDMDPADLRSRIGAVFQDFVRYQFSVAENIGLGDVVAVDDRARIERAAEQGGAAPVIQTLPSGYDTMLGGWFEKGQELSAGQWQKIAVARAFMRDAELLILDEPSASIDAEAEHELFQRFRRLAAERTAIVISHRFSTVRIADRIAVLHDGGIAELGSHDELVKKAGRYAHLFELQAKGYR